MQEAAVSMKVNSVLRSAEACHFAKCSMVTDNRNIFDFVKIWNVMVLPPNPCFTHQSDISGV